MRPRYDPKELAETCRMSMGDLLQHLKAKRKVTYTLAELERGWTEPVADRNAVAMGFHPFPVWPEMCAHAIAELGQKKPTELECPQCGCLFSGKGTYCTDKCGGRARAAMRANVG